MANHKSAIKRIRSSAKKKELNHYQSKTTKTLIKKLRATTDQKEAIELLPKITSSLDKLAKKNIIHKNTASHKKSKLAAFVKSIK